MNIEEEMKKWSQTLYGTIHALHISDRVSFGNLGMILESLRASEGWVCSDIGFESCLPRKKFKDGSVHLDGNGHEDIFRVVAGNVASMFLISLAVMTDEFLGGLIEEETRQDAPNYLSSKVEWAKARLEEPYLWAANGLLELVAIRNALVHSGGKWNIKSKDILGKAGVDTTDMVDERSISISFGDLFRYRRALRTVVGELRKRRMRCS